MTTYESVGNLLSIKNVSKSYGNLKVLNNTSGDIVDIVGYGQIVSLLGPSGVGKTTLLRILSGLTKPDSGEVTAYSSVKQAHVKIDTGVVGVVSQHYPLFDHHTVIENLLVADPKGKDIAIQYLERFGLRSHAHHYPCQLSGGQRQRVAIIQQLMCSDHYILLDEPFSGLDPLMKMEVCNLITEVAHLDEKNTMIIVTHDIAEAVAVSDTIWLMGRDFDSNNNPIQGAYIKKVFDLVALGIARTENIYESHKYADFVRNLKLEFNHL